MHSPGASETSQVPFYRDGFRIVARFFDGLDQALLADGAGEGADDVAVGADDDDRRQELDGEAVHVGAGGERDGVGHAEAAGGARDVVEGAVVHRDAHHPITGLFDVLGHPTERRPFGSAGGAPGRPERQHRDVAALGAEVEGRVARRPRHPQLGRLVAGGQPRARACPEEPQRDGRREEGPRPDAAQRAEGSTAAPLVRHASRLGAGEIVALELGAGG